MIRFLLVAAAALSTLNIKASPFEVAQNVFQEFRQVQEMIRQIEEVIKQIEQQAEMIKNMSGKDIYQMTSAEIELLRWLPEGESLLEPDLSSIYGQVFNEIEEQLDLFDPFEVAGIEDIDDDFVLGPLAFARKEKQRTTIASSSYSKTYMNQFDERVDVITGYLDQLNTSETLKNSVDLNARITGQAVINQIEINKTFAMLLKQKAAEVQEEMAGQRFTHLFIKGESE